MKAPKVGSLEADGIRPETPQKWQGILILPPISLPRPIGDVLAAIDAAYPPELPPTDLLTFHGFKHLPQRKLFESKLNATWGKLVLIKGIIPLFLKQLIITLSFLMMLLALTIRPTVDVVPSIYTLSLIEIGIPNRGGKWLLIYPSFIVQLVFPD